MRHMISLAAVAAASLAVASPAAAQRAVDSRYSEQSEEARFAAAQRRFASELAIFQSAFDRYQSTRNNRDYRDPRYNDQRYEPRYNDDRDEGDYDPAQYYRDGPRYQERVLTVDERVYRGRDGRYYCRRSDGTTGLIVGGITGGVLGNIIAGGHSRTAGTLLGAAVGAVAGQAIDRNSSQEIRCR